MARASTAGSATPKPARSRRAAAAPPEPAIVPSEPTLAISALLNSASQAEALSPAIEPSYRNAAPSYRTSSYVPALPIGEEDRNIFNCPVCSRPLATGVRRCPGCRTRLVVGVPLKRASAFVALGLVAGVLTGGGAMAAAGLSGGTATPPTASQAPIVEPSASAPPATAAVTPTPPPLDPAVPPTARAALGQVATLHAGFLDDAADLRLELAAVDIDAFGVAQTLRSINSQSAFGLDVARRLATWDEAAALAADLDAAYNEIRTIARTGLASSVRNDAAYREAALRMVDAVAALETLDADVRALALTADIDLPRLDFGGPPAASTAP